MEILNTILSSVPDIIKLPLVAILVYLAKPFIEWLKNQHKEKRDDFTAIAEVMKGELERLTERVDKAEQDNNACEAKYVELQIKYKELNEQYSLVLLSNIDLKEEIARLRIRIEQREIVENSLYSIEPPK